MIKLEARIKLFDSDDGIVNRVSINNGNNISSTQNLANKEVLQGRPFLLGNSPLLGGEDTEIPNYKDAYYFTENAGYFIGSVASNERGVLQSPYTITITGSQINAITIVFDKSDNVFPTEININGQTYANDDTTFTVGNLGGVSTVTATINNLNKSNSYLVVLGVYVTITIVVNEKNLESFTYSLYDRENNDGPSYGVVSNSGTLSFIDGTGEILDYANMRLLKDLAGVEVYIVNSITNESQSFIKAFSQEWEYDNDSKEVTVTIEDGLSAILQNIPFYNELFQAEKSAGGNAFVEIYNNIYEKVPSYFSMPAYEDLNEDVKTLIDSISADSYKQEEENLWAALDAFAKAAGLHIYFDNNKIKVEVSQ